ncbi:hypothetical protein LCI18_010921 [Fusarium solani-melongenae]|uniref:Uncharacterized protein n=1 Tax=Fusarium solani subsp. cucurbitae TaxID=2747967 RepID=A0ACD3ZFK0_FUSSC|nr:hypothetical protein LCI18_010921 [Fusarium solani-melongenae]
MASQLITKRRVTGLSHTARRPIKVLEKAARSILHRFKSRRHKSLVVSVSNHGSTSHSNFDVSSDKAATTADVPPVKQAETCPTLDYKPRDFSSSPEIFGSAPTFEDAKVRGIDPRLLAIAGAILELLLPIPLLPQPKLCDFDNVLLKTCPRSPENAPRGHRHGSDRKEHKRTKRNLRGGSSKGDPDDDGNDGEGNDGRKKPDGPRYPESSTMPRLFDCPFHKSDPVRYQCCNGYERFCDVKLHIERRHLLKEEKPYCPNCRIEFSRGGRAARDLHMRGICSKRSIRETGMLLPAEWNVWKRDLRQIGDNAPGEPKWNYMWAKIFDSPPPSPYVGIANADVYRHRAEISLPTTLGVWMWNLGHRNNQLVQSMSQQILDGVFSDFITATEESSEPEPSQQDPSDPGNNSMPTQYPPADYYNEDSDLPMVGYDYPNPPGWWTDYRQ